ncbi:YD repeat-containing protein [Flagellimonas meridianipacifica]|uniref:YD repeat-containing protein n=2 Tax=Flagellimonas meridianipacifica TaxID=1080225 RepID=A0A2T0MHZ4_9FLAO|nr:YD repeat-containing protein [Allomuricauda pacifica]
MHAQSVEYGLINPDHYVERIPSSPEVSQLGTFGNLPVDKYTGTANVNIPLHSIDFDGLSIPLDLTYNTGGIRVTQEATWVGLGWNLAANAVISRKINGYNDFLNLASSTPVLDSRGYIFTPTVNVNSSAHNARLSYNDSVMISESLSYDRIALDLEPDLFTVSLFGRSYSFTLNKWDGASSYVSGINHDNAELIIRYYLNDERFEIVDANGFTYYFASKERSDPYRSQERPYYTGVGSPNIQDEEFARDQVGVIPIDLSKVANAIMSFHIDRIETPFGRNLHFEYEDGVYFTYPSYTHSSVVNPNSVNDFIVVDHNGNEGDAYSVGCNITMMKTKYLKRIYGDFGEVIFNLAPREDLYNWEIHYNLTGATNALPNASIDPAYATNQRCLSNIIVKNKANQTIKQVDFEYTYFNAPMVNDVEPEKYLRLKLDRVSIDDREYVFDYYYENSLPAKDSPSQDFWGFYNGETNRENNKNLRIPSFGRYVRGSSGNGQFPDKYFILEGATRSSNFDYGKVGLLKKVYHPTKGYTQFEYEGNRASVRKARANSLNPNHQNSTFYAYNYQYLERAELQKQGGASVTLGVPFTIVGAETVPGNNFEMTATISCGQYGQGSGDCSLNGGISFDHFIITNVNNPLDTYGLFPRSGMPFDSEFTDTQGVELPNGTYVLNTYPNASAGGFSYNIQNAHIFDIPPGEDLSFVEYEVGGSRLKSISDYDADNGFISRREYDYRETVTENSFRSSGKLMDELIFHSKNGFVDYTPEGYNGTQVNMTSFSYNNGPGNHIGYTVVTEKQVDENGIALGSKLCVHYNERNLAVLRYIGIVPVQGWPNYLEGVGDDRFVEYEDVYYLGLTPNSNAHLNGKVLREAIYNSNDNKVSESIYNYSTHEFDIQDCVKVYYSGASTAPISNYAIYPMYQRVALLESTETTQFFDEDSASPKEVRTVVTNDYNEKNSIWPSQHFWPTKTTTTNSKGESVSTETFYPMQATSPNMSYLIAANRRAIPIQLKQYNENTLLGEQITQYGPLNATSNKHNPRKVVTKKEDGTLEDRVSYDLYDNYGNLLQYTLNDGTPVSYIWGYGQTYPVAKIQNALRSQIDQILETTDFNSGLGGLSTADENSLRTGLPDSMITTYTYKQGVGISSMTDPRGYTTTYEYDSSQRLKTVRDAQDKILSDNEYSYKTSN